MRFPTTALAFFALAACSSSMLPRPQSIPELAHPGQWYRLEKQDESGRIMQTSLLAVEQLPDGIRFVQTDALGAPVSRQTVGIGGWKNDGFVMPNPASRRLFAALLPLLAADRSVALYPDADKKKLSGSRMPAPEFCPDGKGAPFSYKAQDLWCVAHRGNQFLIGFPDKAFWTVSPVEE